MRVSPFTAASRRVHPLFILVVLSTLTPGTWSYSNTPQPPVAPPGTFDWLTAVPADFAAVSLNTWELPRANNSAIAGIELTNGLITRRFTTFPDFATWDYLSHLEDEETSLLRYIGPEGEATPLHERHTCGAHLFTSRLSSPFTPHSFAVRSLFLSLPLLYPSASLTPFLASIRTPPSLPLSGFIDIDDGRYAVGGLNVSDESSAAFPYTRAYLNRSAATTGARKNDSSCVFNYKEHVLLVRKLLLPLYFPPTLSTTRSFVLQTRCSKVPATATRGRSLSSWRRRCFETVVLRALVFFSVF